MIAQRIIVALAAVLAAAWLAVSLAGQSALERASDVSREGKPSPAAIERGIDDAERAADLRPADNEPDLVRGRLLVAADRREEALRAFDDVTRREPENLLAWYYKAVITVDSDRRRSLKELARAQRLDPLGAPRLPALEP